MSNDAPFYEINGERYVRVTRVLDIIRNKEIEQWRGRVGNKEANRVMRKSLKDGDRVHDLIEADLAMLPLKIKKTDPIEVRTAFEAYKEWRRCHPDVHGETEKRVYHSKLKYAGTIDFLTDTTLYDWKTSTRMNSAYDLQLVAYLECLRSMGLPLPTKLSIVRLDKQLGTFEEVSILVEDTERIGRLFKAFNGLLDYYNEIGGSSGEETDRTAEDEDGSGQEVAGSEVSDAGSGEDREVGFLGTRREDPLSGM